MEKLSLAAAARDYGRVSIGNTKMPGTTFAVSATKCNVGGKLAAVKNSVCHSCYALRLEKLRPSVAQGWAANYFKAIRMIEEKPDQWAAAMAFQVKTLGAKTGEKFHRWFDSGDLASVAMLRAIVKVCELTPDIKHWMPTRETGVVKNYRKQYGEFPANLVVRVSSPMINDAPIAGHANTSTVHNKSGAPIGEVCAARTRGNQCGPCRACWDKAIANISYPLH